MEASPVHRPADAGRLRGRADALRRSESAQPALLAGATIFQQLAGVVFTVVFTRILGTGGYGALAALVNLTVILLVPGSALQVAAAREATLGRLGRGASLAATLDRWMRHALLGVAGLAVAAALAREPLAALVNVEDEWAAACVPVAAGLWLLLCVQRGLLQGEGAYQPVAASIVVEGAARIAAALLLVGIGLGVTGAYLGVVAGILCASGILHRALRRRLGAPARGTARHSLTALLRKGAVPIAGLSLVAGLQNVDVIMARHALDADAAGVYAAATVAAKAIVWVAIGIGLWVLPEATRRAVADQDPRPVLLRALALVGLLAVPALAIFAAIPGLVLELAFGSDYRSGEDVLLVLGLAFALLACTTIAVQFLFGLHRRAFVAALAVVAVGEPLLLLGADSLAGFSGRVLVAQAAGAAVAVGLALRARRDPLAGTEPVL